MTYSSYEREVTRRSQRSLIFYTKIKALKLTETFKMGMQLTLTDRKLRYRLTDIHSAKQTSPLWQSLPGWLYTLPNQTLAFYSHRSVWLFLQCLHLPLSIFRDALCLRVKTNPARTTWVRSCIEDSHMGFFPVFFGGYHPTLKLSGICTFTFIVSLTHRMDNICTLS